MPQPSSSLRRLNCPSRPQTTIRITASNVSSGNYQSYVTAGTHILQALKPDVVCMQEFNVPGANDDAAVTAWVTSTFGAGYQWYREPKASANIPNGIISRYPILAAGEWGRHSCFRPRLRVGQD